MKRLTWRLLDSTPANVTKVLCQQAVCTVKIASYVPSEDKGCLLSNLGQRARGFWHASVFKKTLGWNTNQCFAHSRHSRSDDEIEQKFVKDVLLRVVLCTSHKILASDYCSSLQSSKLCYLVTFGYTCFVFKVKE